MKEILSIPRLVFSMVKLILMCECTDAKCAKWQCRYFNRYMIDLSSGKSFKILIYNVCFFKSCFI